MKHVYISYRGKILLTVMVVFLITLACTTSTTGEKVGENPLPNAAPVKAQVYNVGDIIRVEDYTITLNSANVQGSKLLANFTIDNSTGAKELNISSMLNFDAKDTDGNKLSFSFCEGSQLDGKILTGDKLKGTICWDGVKAAAVKIYYMAEIFGSGAIVWNVGN